MESHIGKPTISKTDQPNRESKDLELEDLSNQIGGTSGDSSHVDKIFHDHRLGNSVANVKNPV